MEEKNSHTQDNLPVYNIKAVAQQLGLLPVTLRAWERRYGLPSPLRGQQGYRLYSEYDLRTLRWLKSQLETGLSIGRAAQYLDDLRTQGRDPVASLTLAEAENPASLAVLSQELLGTLMRMDDIGAAAIIRRAFALYPVDEVLVNVIQNALVEVGDAWHRGEIPIATEHFATALSMQQLMSMLASSSSSTHPGVIVAACAPGEMHQIGLLMLVVMLRWRGWDVKYFGADLSLDRLEEALIPLKPRLILFSATRPETLTQLLPLSNVLGRFPLPAPRLVFGGSAFLKTALPEGFPALVVNGTPSEMIERIEALMHYQG